MSPLASVVNQAHLVKKLGSETNLLLLTILYHREIALHYIVDFNFVIARFSSGRSIQFSFLPHIIYP